MIIKIVLLLGLSISLLFLFKNSHSEKTVQYRSELFYLGGIQINEADNKAWAELLKKSSMNTVEVTVYATQGKWDSDSLRYEAEDLKVMDQIRSAKEAGLKVVLILRVHLDYSFDANKFMWHGMVMPKDSATLHHWFVRYTSFVSKWAKIAQKEGVDVVGVGSEMNALSSTLPIRSMPDLYAYHNSISKQKSHEYKALHYKKELNEQDMWINGYQHEGTLKSYIDERIDCKIKWAGQVTFEGQSRRIDRMNARRIQCAAHWRQLIKIVRDQFKGSLTYAANFDNYVEVEFWDALDFVGINAYFGLRQAYQQYEDDTQFLKLMKSGWNRAFEGVNAFRKKQNIEHKPLLFTELGYINRRGCTVHPWQGFGYSVVGFSYYEALIRWTKEPYNYRERNLAMQALYEVVKEQKINLEGLLYWKLTSHDYHMPYEPFALHLTLDVQDSLQATLMRFATLTD